MRLAPMSHAVANGLSILARLALKALAFLSGKLSAPCADEPRSGEWLIYPYTDEPRSGEWLIYPYADEARSINTETKAQKLLIACKESFNLSILLH